MAQAKVAKVISPAAVTASRTNLVKARAARVHHKGNQTSKQLAAQRTNLIKARAHRHKVGVHHGHGPKRSGVHRHAGVPLGTFRLRPSMHGKLTIRKPTGINPRFRKEISATGYARHGGWQRARTHHRKMHLHIRRKHGMRMKAWRIRKGRLTSK